MDKNMQEKIIQFEKACQPIFEFARQHLNPHEAIIITDRSAKIVSDEISVPKKMVTKGH